MELDLTLQTIMGSLLSQFVSALLGALLAAVIGGLSGAYAAAFLSDRQKRKDAVDAELRACNQIILLAQTVASGAVNLKRQFVIPDIHSYNAEREAFDAFLAAKTAGRVPPQQAYEQKIEYQIYQLSRLPLERLVSKVEGELSVLPRPLVFSSILENVYANLKYAMETRNEFINKTRARDLDDQSAIFLYFGRRKNDGSSVDETYFKCMEAIEKLTDDCLFFSLQIIKDVRQHAHDLADKHGLKDRRGINVVPSKLTISDEILPKEDNYREWLMVPRNLDVS